MASPSAASAPPPAALDPPAAFVARALTGVCFCPKRSPLDAPAIRGALTAVPLRPFFPPTHGDPEVEAEEVALMETTARLALALEIRPGSRVLEIGTGTGYAAAVFGRMGAVVLTVERDPARAAAARERLAAAGARGVTVLTADGSLGAPDRGPFDAILVSCSGGRIATEIGGQLVVGGRLVRPAGLHRLAESIVRITRTGDATWKTERFHSPSRPRLLGDILVQMGAVSREEAERAAALSVASGRRIGETLQRTAGLAPQLIYLALAGQRGFRFRTAEDLAPFLDPSLRGAASESYLSHNRMVPVGRQDGAVVFATCDPASRAGELAQVFHPEPVELVLVTPADLERLRDLPERTASTGVVTGPPQELAGDAEAAATDSDVEARLIELFHETLREAVTSRASDIHFERYGPRVRIRFRIDGDLVDRESGGMSATDLVGVINVLKVQAELDIAERRLPQGGRIGARVEGKGFDLRVQTQPSLHGEHAVIRLLPQEAKPVGVEALGFPGPIAERYRRLLDAPAGLLLVVGPTGSGKTTTLYAGLLTLREDATRKVITIEDPIEYALEGVQQTQVNLAVGFQFATATRSFLRQDPDVILVGEIRDQETALEAIRASQTGHVVLSTLHCNDATDAVQRLFDLGMHPNSIASELAAVFSQQLARRNCTECRAPEVADPRLLAEVFPSGPPAGFRSWKGKGCPSCKGRGTTGRVAIVEFLPVNAVMKDVIARHPTVGELRRAARAAGLVTARASALEHVASGLVALSELRGVLAPERLAEE
jgi:type IV pilus assembly protein PilB